MANLQETDVQGSVRVFGGEFIEAPGGGTAIRFGQSIVVPGTVEVGSTPVAFLAVGASENQRIVGVRAQTTTGTVDVTVQYDGADVTTLTGVGTTASDNLGLDQAVAEGGTLSLALANVNGAENLSVTVIIESVGIGAAGEQVPTPWENGVVRYSQTYPLPGTIAAGDTVPAFFEAVSADETKSLVAVRHVAGAGSATITIQRNGGAVAGYGGIAVDTTADITDAADVQVADGDIFNLVVDAATDAEDITISLIFETTTA